MVKIGKKRKKEKKERKSSKRNFPKFGLSQLPGSRDG